MTLPRNLPLVLIVALGLVHSTCQAGIGGNTRWKVPILPASQVDGTADLVGAEGEDGVVVIRLGSRVFEVDTRTTPVPSVVPTPLTGSPFARVLDCTYTRSDNQLQWKKGSNTPVVLPLRDSWNLQSVAVAADGSVYTLTRVANDGLPCYLSRWRPTGELQFRQPVGTRFSSPVRLAIGNGGTVYASTYSNLESTVTYALHAFADTGKLLWQAPDSGFIVAGTSGDGVMVVDRYDRIVRWKSGGFPDQVERNNGESTIAVTPSDDRSNHWSIPNVGNVALLADGGSILVRALPPWEVIRLGTTGVRLWSRSLINGSWPLLGNGLIYFLTKESPPQGEAVVMLYAIEAGAPLADSAWPTAGGPPDGSRQARQRSHAVPFVTMLHHSPRSGSILQFGAERGKQYSIEAAATLPGPWSPVGMVSSDTFGAQFIDPTATMEPRRFYRVVRLL